MSHNENDELSLDQYGVMTEKDTIRFKRVLPGPIERVWACLTDSEKRGTWLAPGPMELMVGGKVELHFCHADLSQQEEATPERFKQYEGGHINYGRITRYEPPYVLSYTWGEGNGEDTEVTFELSEREGNVILILTHRRLGDSTILLSVAGGWHTHLEFLSDQLLEQESPSFWTRYLRIEDEYKKRLTSS